MNTHGFGVTISAGEFGAEFSYQCALVQDGETGRWYYVVTQYSGAGWSVVPGSISFDVFGFRPGVSIADVASDEQGFLVHFKALLGGDSFIKDANGNTIGSQFRPQTHNGATRYGLRRF